MREDVSLGQFDILEGKMVVPHGEAYFLDSIRNDAWIETDAPQHEGEMEPGSFKIGLVLLNRIPSVAGASTPDLDRIVANTAVTFPSLGK